MRGPLSLMVLLASAIPAGSRGAPNPETLLRAGAVVVMHSTHPDAEDDYEFRVSADGARTLDCVLPGLPHEAFRAVFSKEALASGDAVLAVTQTNPTGRQQDGRYSGDTRPRSYTFRATTPPFLLSDGLAARVRDRQPIRLHFYDSLDQGRALDLSFTATGSARILVDGRPRDVDVVRYQGGGLSLEVVAGSRFVRAISRNDDELQMRVTELRTRRRRTVPVSP